MLHSELVIEPRPDDRSRRLDEHGNEVEYFTIERPHDGLSITATSELDVDPYDISPAAARTWESTRDAVVDPTPDREFLLESPLVPSCRRARGTTPRRRSRPVGRCSTPCRT